MKNNDKFVTPQERERAFETFCYLNQCKDCPVDYAKQTYGISRCVFAWLNLETKVKEAPQWQENFMGKFTDKE